MTLEEAMETLWQQVKKPTHLLVRDVFWRNLHEFEKFQRICTPAGLADLFPALKKKQND